LREAFTLTPEFLRTAEAEAAGSQVRNLMDTGFQLGRRFRALKLWVVIRYFGLEGIRVRMREHIRLAKLFASWVEEEGSGFELMAPVSFGVVCFRAVPPGVTDGGKLDEFNERLLAALNDTGEVFLLHTKLGEQYALRLAIGNIDTAAERVRVCFEKLYDLAATLKVGA
jgi:aromatic-L-amino-acid decarboxylase